MSDLVTGIAEFVQSLRQSGVGVGPGDSIDALRALSHLDLSDRAQVYLGLRSVLAKRVVEYAPFDAAFRRFFDGEDAGGAEVARPYAAADGPVGEAEGGREGGYSPAEVLVRSDLATLGEGELAEATSIARRIARRLALRLSRRSRSGRRGARLSLRLTARRAARYGGLPLALVWRRPRPKPANLVLLLDVSGSMELYSRILLQFVYALQSSLPRVRSFCFATRLAPVSEEMESLGYDAAVRRARAKVEGWGGGTRIGACLGEFVREWGHALLGRRSAVIILSDGLDTGDPRQVESAMGAIRRGARRVIWLNPLAGDSRYEPLARGMAAALPFVDLLAPGHSLQSLAALDRELALLKGGWRRD